MMAGVANRSRQDRRRSGHAPQRGGGVSRVLLLVALGLSSATPAASADIIISGAGTSSCGTWTAERRARSATATVYPVGVGLSERRRSLGAGLNPMKGTDAPPVWAWMDNYCQAHPLIAIVDAAYAFVQAHPGKD